MITPQELRIDNYVWNSTQCIPVLVDVKIIQEQINASKGFGIPWEPITLTEEILLKCGFVKKKKLYSSGFIYFLDGFSYESEFTDSYSRYFDGLCFVLTCIPYDVQSLNIEYLHQLQNLYFDLTGQELEIKL